MNMHGISEARFRTLCEEIYRDRVRIYEFNTAAPRAETLLWVLLGSLFSLLSLRDQEMPIVAEPMVEGYVEAICKVVNSRNEGAFDPRPILQNLIARTDTDSEVSITGG